MPSQDASVVASLNESLSTPDKKNVSVLKKHVLLLSQDGITESTLRRVFFAYVFFSSCVSVTLTVAFDPPPSSVRQAQS